MHSNHVTRFILVLSCLSLYLIGLIGHVADAQEETDEANSARIAELIKQLDADGFQDRERAEQDLRRIGKKAVPGLKDALGHDSPEVRIRAKAILKAVTRSIFIVENVEHRDLNRAVSVAISPDSKFLYTAAYAANGVGVFAVDEKTGKLNHQQTVTDRDHSGAVCVRISRDGTLAAATCFRAKTVILYRRDVETGRLDKLAVFRGSMMSGPLVWPVECGFSTDGKHLLLLDPYRKDPATGIKTGSLLVLKTDGGKLECVQALFGKEAGKDGGKDLCFIDGRGIDFHPNGGSLYVAASDSRCVVALDWDAKAGRATIKQIVRDQQDGVTGLDGVMSLTCSNDGKFLYTSSGRFRGDSAVGVFSIDKGGKLSRVQELIAGKDDIGNFLGGNELTLSGDGKNLYVTGTVSGTLAGFGRDPKTGKLTFIETVPLGQEKELGPAGIAINKDGTFVYVAVESAGKVAIFKRPKE